MNSLEPVSANCGWLMREYVRESLHFEVTEPATLTVDDSYECNRTAALSFFPSEFGHEHDATGNCVVVDNGKGFYRIDSEEGWVAGGTGTKIR